MSDFWAWRPWSVGVKRHKSPNWDIKKVWREANKLRAASPLTEMDSAAFSVGIIMECMGDTGLIPSEAILDATLEMLDTVYHGEGLSIVNERALGLGAGSKEAFAARDYLRRQIRFIQNYDTYMPMLQSHLKDVCMHLYSAIPYDVVMGKVEGDFLSTRFSDLMDDLAFDVEAVGNSSFREELSQMGLLDLARHRFEANVMNVSKIDPRNPPSNMHAYKMPTEVSHLSHDQLVDQYLVGTPFRKFFHTELPLPINTQARFEHSHILGGTGHGKTQFIQKWIAHDIEAATKERRSIVVIDSQGDLINKIARLDVFHPTHGALRDKLIIIDPNDVQFPAAINMFAMDETRLSSYGLAEREKVQNSAIALYEHFFGELLGAELTAKQGVVFKYLARLMLEIPDATILTLRDLVDDPTPFIPYMDKLTGSARIFFAREFLDKSFAQTRKQISKRLWGVLSTPAFERLFSSTRSRIDLFAAMNEGSVILISTAKDLLKQDGASLYGRFFLSMIGQAIMERAVIPEGERTPTFLYVDECQDYFDETIEVLLAQGRKYKIGVTLAHQYLDQLDTGGRSSVLANTSIKAAGGMNAKDAKTLASEMRVTSDYLQSMTKTAYGSDFAFWVKHDLPNAIKVNVPFGELEGLPRMSDTAFEDVLTQNRERNCWRFTPQASALDVSFPGMGKREETVPPQVAAPPPMLDAKQAPVPPVTGRGGEGHVKIQNMIKSIANAYGWRADLEHTVTDGSVDVWLAREGKSIACEISVTTPTAYEVHNVEKCLNAGADEVWAISEDPVKLAKIESHFKTMTNISYLSPDDVPGEIEARSDIAQSDPTQIRGYSVSVKRAVTTQEDLSVRRARIDRLLKAHKI